MQSLKRLMLIGFLCICVFLLVSCVMPTDQSNAPDTSIEPSLPSEPIDYIHDALAFFQEIQSYRLHVTFDFEFEDNSSFSDGQIYTQLILYNDDFYIYSFIKPDSDDIALTLITHDEKAYAIYPNEDQFYRTEVLLLPSSPWRYQSFVLDALDFLETYEDRNNLYVYHTQLSYNMLHNNYLTFLNLPTTFFKNITLDNFDSYDGIVFDIEVGIDKISQHIGYITIDYMSYFQAYYKDDENNPLYEKVRATLTFDYKDDVIFNSTYDDFLVDDASSSTQVGTRHQMEVGTFATTDLQYDLDIDIFEFTIIENGNYLFETEGVMAHFYLKDDQMRLVYTSFTPYTYYMLTPGNYYLIVTQTIDTGLVSVKLSAP